MEKSYETFVTDLRKLLLAAMDLKEEEIYFSNDGEKYGCLGDRLFVESGHMEKAKTVCGLHTEELYKRYCQEHSFENIVHDCVREIKKVSENCVLCDLDDLKDYEKIKSRLFIRLLNADYTEGVGSSQNRRYCFSGLLSCRRKRGICSECKDQEKLCGEMGKRCGYCFRSCSNKYIFYQSTKNLSLGKNAV